MQLTKSKPGNPTTGMKLEHTVVSRKWMILFLEDSFCINDVESELFPP